MVTEAPVIPSPGAGLSPAPEAPVETQPSPASIETPPPAIPAAETATQQPAAPTTTPAPQPPAPSPTFGGILPENVAPEVREYVTALEGQVRAAREQQERQQLDQTVQRYAQQLEAQYGLAAEHAQAIARQQGEMLYAQYQRDQMRTAQINAAFAIAKEYGIDARQLIDLPSPQAMRQTAQAFAATTRQSQEIAALRAQVEKLTKAQIPAQTMSQGVQPGAGPTLTGDALEAAYVKHEREHPDIPNPYEAQYRVFLNR